jgi:2-polyprenyl-3-methyl-5-hydroxy-6-metoxy-1,4-benzoquinol methylase
MQQANFLETNRLNWEERVPIHLRDVTGFYNIEAFLAGRSEIGPIEAAELGDVRGRRLLHLQCHFGLGTLSLARCGADATGLDFSPSAIKAAHDFARRTGIAARFVEGNVYDAAALSPGPFDIIYTTWGTITWLPDIARWAQTIAAVLAPGGFLYFADDHPAAQMLEEVDGRLVASYSWRTPADTPLAFEAATTYNGDPTQLANTKSYQWIHPLSDIVSALLGAGLQIEMLHEHEVLPWKPFSMMVAAGQGYYRLPDGVPSIPLTLSLRARKMQATPA